MKTITLGVLLMIMNASILSAEINSNAILDELDCTKLDQAYWTETTPEKVVLVAQPMIAPRPKQVTTPELEVRSVHNDQKIAFLLTWKDNELSEAGKLGEFSDAVAMEFPVANKEVPPPVFMGAKGDPVHIFHWRAQYQRDQIKGKPSMKDLYPNLNIDTYPMEYPDWGNLQEVDAEKREVFSPAKASGNPQSYAKSGIDEILAEGFSTSSVQSSHGACAMGEWKDNKWKLIFVRPLQIEGGSSLTIGSKSHTAFAVWQGGEKEVGSRKSVTMVWMPLTIASGESKEGA